MRNIIFFTLHVGIRNPKVFTHKGTYFTLTVLSLPRDRGKNLCNTHPPLTLLHNGSVDLAVLRLLWTGTREVPVKLGSVRDTTAPEEGSSKNELILIFLFWMILLESLLFSFTRTTTFWITIETF